MFFLLFIFLLLSSETLISSEIEESLEIEEIIVKSTKSMSYIYQLGSSLNVVSVEEIAKKIGADKLIYQDLEDLILAVQENNSEINLTNTLQV